MPPKVRDDATSPAARALTASFLTALRSLPPVRCVRCGGAHAKPPREQLGRMVAGHRQGRLAPADLRILLVGACLRAGWGLSASDDGHARITCPRCATRGEIAHGWSEIAAADAVLAAIADGARPTDPTQN